MELRGWQQCQRKALQCTGTLSVLPPSWDTISSIYSQVLRLVSNWPYNKRLVLYFAYKGTTVKIDFGDVKAAGAVCILGLGVGLGTLFIYRLYRHYIRPFLDHQCPDPENPASHDCSRLSDSSDSGVDGAMGNNSSAPTPAVFYSAQYGVALGRRAMSPRQQEQVVADNVRLRRMGTRQKPAAKHSVERDSRARSSNLSPSLYDPRDSYYSTAESGFETLPECIEEEEEEEAEEDSELSPSLKENFSASSLKERNDRYFLMGGVPAGEGTVVDRPVFGDQSGGPSVPIVKMEPPSSSDKSSPVPTGGRVQDTHLLSANQCNSLTQSDSYDYDTSLDASESIQSFNSSGEEWSMEEEEKGASPLSATHTAMTDKQFRQSLMQRIRDWSNFAEEYGKSRSPTPDCSALSQPLCMRRSRSLDHHLGEPASVAEAMDITSSDPIANQDTTTIRNLETLETEFHNIQGEFESITSKLHELIEKGQSESGERAQRSPARPVPSHHLPHHAPRGRPPHSFHTSPLRARPRTKWERMPSLSRSDSSISSRASSLEFSWDCGEVGGEGGEAGQLPVTMNGQGDGGSRQLSWEPVFAEGDLQDDSADRVISVGDAVSIEEYAEREWRGDTAKARTIRKGYAAVPDLFHCQRIRQVRGDNYCALRSTLFQVLVGGHRVTHRWPGLISIVDRLHELNADGGSGLSHWTFGGRLKWEGEEKFSTITQCVLSLYATIEEMSALPTEEERLSRTLSLLNSSERFDCELMEGMKLMMLFRANDLQREIREGSEVPTFAWLLFARDTSSDVVSFVKNHLNSVGDSAGIDQVEMCLLGHCLGVKLRVARLDHHGQQEFDCSFPEEAPEDWPFICLLAEDDRHYNVPVV